MKLYHPLMFEESELSHPDFEMKLQPEKKQLHLRVETEAPGYSINLQSSSAEVLLAFRVNPRRPEYTIDLKGLTIGAYWVILKHNNLDVKRHVFQVV